MSDNFNSKKSFYALWIVALGALVGSILMFAGIAWLFQWFSKERPVSSPSAVLTTVSRVQGPLEIDSGEYFKQYLAEQEQLLRNYRWLDPQTGTVQIPIENAMRRLVEREAKEQNGPQGSEAETHPEEVKP